MRLLVDMSELEAELERCQTVIRKERRRIWRDMRKVSFALERGIKDEMPKDTGAATAGWGHWSAGDIRRVSSDSDWGPGDAIYREDETNLEIEQGTNREYVEQLNEGHSQQAPAGFIDRRCETAERELAVLVENSVDI